MQLRCTASREGKLESFLRRELSMSSSLVSRLKWQDALLVNGEAVHTNHPVHPGDAVAVRLDETVEGFEPEEMALSVLYEDEALIALDKPAGMLTHPSPSRNEGTLANGLLAYYRASGQKCGIHPVSRLDRDTFGVVLLAVIGIIHYMRNSYQDKIRTRMIFEMFITVDILSFVFIILQPQHFDNLLPIIIVNTSCLFAHYVALTRIWLTNVTFIVMCLATLGLTIFNLMP